MAFDGMFEMTADLLLPMYICFEAKTFYMYICFDTKTFLWKNCIHIKTKYFSLLRIGGYVLHMMT